MGWNIFSGLLINAQGRGAQGSKALIYQCRREKGAGRASWELSGADIVLTVNTARVQTSAGARYIASEEMSYTSPSQVRKWSLTSQPWSKSEELNPRLVERGANRVWPGVNSGKKKHHIHRLSAGGCQSWWEVTHKRFKSSLAAIKSSGNEWWNGGGREKER